MKPSVVLPHPPATQYPPPPNSHPPTHVILRNILLHPGLIPACMLLSSHPPSTFGTQLYYDNSGSSAIPVFAWAIPLALLAAICLGLTLGAAFLWRRLLRQQQHGKERLLQEKMMKTFMYNLATAIGTEGVGGGGAAGGAGAPPGAARAASPSTVGGAEALAAAKEMAFVVTDIEGSTQLSSTCPPGMFEQLQEIHDQIMREGIAKYVGWVLLLAMCMCVCV